MNGRTRWLTLADSGPGSAGQYVYVGGLPSWYNTKLKVGTSRDFNLNPKIINTPTNLSMSKVESNRDNNIKISFTYKNDEALV